MKYLFSLLLLLGMLGLSQAETGLNYQSFKLLETKVAKEKKEKDEKKWTNKGGDRIVFSFGFDNWFHGEPGGFKTQWFSFGWGIHFMYDFPINGSAVSVAAGAGFHFSYVFHNATMVDTVGRTYFDPIENFGDGADIKRSRTYMSFFEIPVELRFRTKPNRKNDQFKIAAGFKFGLRMGASAKQKREVNGDTKKFTEKGFSDLSQIRYGPTFRVGYSSYNLFFFYDLNSLFKSGRGPRTFNGFTAGIQFNGL